MRRSVIIVAAGRGERMAADRNKALLPLQDRPVLAHTLELWSNLAQQIVVAYNPADLAAVRDLCAPYGGRVLMVPGGSQRAASVARALAALPMTDGPELVAVHDAARPLTLPADIEATFTLAGQVGAAILAAPLTDTVRQRQDDRLVGALLPREQLVAAQTPQIFRRELLQQAYAVEQAVLAEATDDAALVQRLGQAVAYVWATGCNVKLTRPTDLLLAELVLRQRQEGCAV